MDRKQAAEIKRHLLNAGRALNRADFALYNLGKAEREPFADMMLDLYHTLHFKVLPALYAQHPELEPPDPPRITSKLRWQDVSLPHPISAAYLDALIFAELRPTFLKMARIVGKVCLRCEEQMNPVDAEIIAARVIALAEAGRIEGAGDLRMWRHSEVKLP
jgi:uncharacterized protein DUF3658